MAVLCALIGTLWNARSGAPEYFTSSERLLASAGITTAAHLRRIGSVAAYARVQHVQGKLSLNLLWALEGALTDLPWQVVAREHRTRLQLALEERQRVVRPTVRPPARGAVGAARAWGRGDNVGSAARNSTRCPTPRRQDDRLCDRRH